MLKIKAFMNQICPAYKTAAFLENFSLLYPMPIVLDNILDLCKIKLHKIAFRFSVYGMSDMQQVFL